MKLSLISLSLIAVCAVANANSYDVYAYQNSSSGGTGVATIGLTAGESFTVTVDPGMLWNAGALPRWSNADGLTHDLYATGSDASGQSAGTLIGINFGLWSEGDLSAAYGTLVGQIEGSSHFFALGTNFSGVASSTGTLDLYYWDSNYSDNSGFVTANVQAVPEPMSMLAIGAGLVGLARRKRN